MHAHQHAVCSHCRPARAVDEILLDMASPQAMSRLLWETWAQARPLWRPWPWGPWPTRAVVSPHGPPRPCLPSSGRQGGALLDAADITWALLTGATPKAQRESILENLAQGRTCVLFGIACGPLRGCPFQPPHTCRHRRAAAIRREPAQCTCEKGRVRTCSS